MSLISTWSTVANDNGTLGTYPFYWPEGQPPSSVNDCARLMMATIRTQWNDAQWFNWGYTVARVSGNSFTAVTASWNTVATTDVFVTGGRLKLSDTSTLYGTITTVSASAISTLVTFTPDTGSLTASFSAVYNSILTPDGKSLPSGTVPPDVVRQSGSVIYGVDAGISDAYAANLTPPLTSYVAGQSFNIRVNSANTGAATLNLDGLGVKGIKLPNGTDLPDNYLVGGSIMHVVYDGTNFQIVSVKADGGGGGGGGGSGVTLAVTQANSFTGGEWLYLNGSTYTVASNASEVTAEVVGVVAYDPAPTGAGFTLQTNGILEGGSGLSAGTVYFLGTGGALTATPPTADGTIVKPLLVANSTTDGIIINFRGEINEAPSFPYDLAFLAGFNSAGANADVTVQTYGQLVMARSGSFTGDVGSANTAPTGAAMILNIEKNGTTIYTVKPQFAISATTMTAGTLKTDGTEDFVSGDVITFKITQIGSTAAGQGVKFTVTGVI